MKALGTGHSHGVLWRDVEVVRRGGPPQLRLHGGAARRFAAMGGRSSLFTNTPTSDRARALVLIRGDCRTAGCHWARPRAPNGSGPPRSLC